MTATPVTPRRRNPYVGPRAIRRGEEIHGREREAMKLADLLIAERVVLLHSPSGAGKTSLIEAALVPYLEKLEERKEDNFRVLPLIRVNLEPPDPASLPVGFNRYVLSAISCLEAVLPASRQRHLAELAGMRLTEYLDQIANDDERDQVLIFDQFEEILTVDPIDWQGHDAFFRQIGAALTDTKQPRWALFSMREEYVGGLDRYVRRVPTHLAVNYRLDFLERKAALQAVQGPVAKLPVTFSNDAAEELVDDLSMTWAYRSGSGRERRQGPYVEPVQLQVVCHRLWKSLGADTTKNREIKPKHLKQFKNVDRALAEYYGDGVRTVAEETGVSERALRDWFETSLISEDGLRQQTSKGPEPGGEAAERALLRLEGEGIYLIRGEVRPGGARWYELAHDRLIDPIRENNAEWRDVYLNRFQRLAQQWSQDESDLLLLVGTEQDEFERWMRDHQQEATANERRFLEAGNKARAQRRLRRLLTRVALVSALIVLLLAILAALSYRNAAEQRDLAQSRELVAAAFSSLDDDPELSILLAREAVRDRLSSGGGLRPEERDVLYESIAASRVQARFESTGAARPSTASPQPGAAAATAQTGFADVALHPGGNVVAFASWKGGVELWSNNPPMHLRNLMPPSTGNQGGEPPAVVQVAFSGDGRLAAANQSGTTTLWDIESGRLLRSLRQEAQLTSVAFSDSGELLATGAADGSATVWDARSGRRLTVLRHPGPVTAVAFDNGDQVATASGGIVSLWEARSGRRTGQGYRSTVDVNSLAFNPNGAWLAAAGQDGTATLWQLASGRQLPPLSGHTNSVLWIGFAPDGKRVATTSSDGTAKVWDGRTGHELLTLRGHSGPIGGAAFTPDGTGLLTASSDGTGRRWLVASGHAGFVNDISFDPQQRRLVTVSTDRTVRIWNVESRRQLQILSGHKDDVRQVVFDRQGNLLATASADGTARIWDAATGRLRREIEAGGPVNAVAFAPDGSRLALAGDDGTASVYEVGSGKRLLMFEAHTGPVNDIAWSPDGTGIATVGNDGLTNITDATSGARKLLLAHTDRVLAVAFSPDGTLLASGSADHTTTVWDGRDGRERYVLGGHTGAISDVAFSPDGQQLATASWDKSARTWEVRSGRELLLLRNPAEVNGVAFSPDSKFVATASSDKNFHLYPLVETDLSKEASVRVTRSLSPVECDQYLHQTCEGTR
jgi:WD40 repeat protein